MCRPDDWWGAIEKVLPSHIDRTRLRDELGRVRQMQAGPSPEQQRLLRKLEHDLERAAAMLGPAAHDLKQACANARRRPQLFALQCGMLWAWDRAGGGLGVSTPYKSKDVASWPEPSGEVITFFQAAAKAILGKDVGAERAKVIARLYRHMNFTEALFVGEGKLVAALGIIDKDGNEVLDDANRQPKP